jgi:hypothetical protein
MNTISIQTKFTFGARVRFDSPSQQCSGIGKVLLITMDAERRLDYVIEVDGNDELQPGILEDEVSLIGEDLESSERCHTIAIQTKFTLGDCVRFDSSRQRCSGTGKIDAISVDANGWIGFMIEVDGRSEIQGGILEEEITLLAEAI